MITCAISSLYPPWEPRVKLLDSRRSSSRALMRDEIDSNSFVLGCQRALLGAFLGLSAGPAGALPAAPPSDGSARLDPGPGLDLPGLSGWRLGGSLSVNWRNVGPREPGFETQIQNEVYLAD